MSGSVATSTGGRRGCSSAWAAATEAIELCDGGGAASAGLPAPASMLTSPFGSMRSAISAPIRLSRSVCTRPVRRLMSLTPTSAFGALATTVPCASRTTISRRRSAERPTSSRSSRVPPTSTLCLPPSLSSIAEVSQGVTKSIAIGPEESCHQMTPLLTTAANATAPPPIRHALQPRRARRDGIGGHDG